MKKAGAREVVLCLNNNKFLGLDIVITLAGSPVGCYTTRDAPNIVINTNNKTPCNQMPKIVTG